MTQMAAVFDFDPAVLAAFGLARDAFESWAANDVTDPLPSHPVDAMQISLMRWQRRMFGDQIDERMALGMIEEIGEGFDADTPIKAEEALDALGDVSVYAAQLSTSNRLAIAPMFDLARIFQRRTDLIRAPSVLAQVVLKGKQKIRGLDDERTYKIRLTAAIALCIARAIEQVEVMHDIAVKAHEVFLVVGSEVLQRGEGHDAIPKPKPQEIPVMSLEERKQAAFDNMQRALPDAPSIPQGRFDTSDETVVSEPDATSNE